MHQIALFQEIKLKCFSLLISPDKTIFLKKILKKFQIRASKSKTQTTQVLQWFNRLQKKTDTKIKMRMKQLMLKIINNYKAQNLKEVKLHQSIIKL